MQLKKPLTVCLTATFTVLGNSYCKFGNTNLVETKVKFKFSRAFEIRLTFLLRLLILKKSVNCSSLINVVESPSDVGENVVALSMP